MSMDDWKFEPDDEVDEDTPDDSEDQASDITLFINDSYLSHAEAMEKLK